MYNKITESGADLTLCTWNQFDDATGKIDKNHVYAKLKQIPTEFDNKTFNWRDIKYSVFWQTSVPWDKMYKRDFLIKKNVKFPGGTFFEDNVFVYDILEDSYGKLWLATYSDGVFCYDLPQNRWKHYKWIPEDSTSLPYNKVISIFEDSHKRIWFTTQGAGFCRFCPEADNFVCYDMTDGYVPVEPGIGTGDLWDSGYGFFPFGSYVRHLDEEDGIVRYGFLSEEGQVVIESDDAGSYVITVNVTTRDGFTVSGTYSGKVDIINEASEPERSVQSRIYEDKVLDLSNTTSADVDFYGTEKNDMTHYYQIFAQDPVSRQGFQLQLLAPAGETGALAGVYKPAESLMPDKLLPYTYIIGDIQLVSGGAAMIGTWGYYETNEDGRAVAFAPAMFGDITITESETTPGQFIIDYVLTDDNLDEPHTMTAHFTGTFDITDHTESASAAEYLLPAGNDVRRAPVAAPEGRRLRCEEVLKAVRR